MQSRSITKLTLSLCACIALVSPQVVQAETTAVPSTEQEATEKQKVFNAQSFTLSNGLEVVIVENHRAPVVTHMVWYRAGAADEPPGKSGIAHFLEHLLFKGHSHSKLGTYAPGEFSRIVRSLGGEGNAFTSQDYTAYYQSIAVEHLETVMKMEAGRMRGLNPPIEEVEAENKVILEERLQRTDNDPRAQMGEQLSEALFPNHPYSIPVIGWYHEMATLNWDDAKAFYDLYYAPNNAIVVISGDVTASDVHDIAKRTYGKLRKRDVPARVRTSSPPFIASTSVTLEHEIIKETTLKRVYRVPSYRQDAKMSLALQVFEEIMGGGSTSRLYKTLVVEKKLATDVSLSYYSAAWDDSTFSITAIPVSQDKIELLQDTIDEQLHNIAINGVTDQELSDAVTRMQAEAIFARDSLTGPAMVIGYNMVTGMSLDDIESWPLQIASVTQGQIQAAAHAYLNPDEPYIYPPVFGLLLPKETATPDQSQGDAK
ncbi:MAG: M16 family metallopeptidase [Alphaproteobacteria bacterium]